MPKRLSPAAMVALKDALCTVYWYKKDLRTFVHSTVSDARILARLNWDALKRDAASELVDLLAADSDRHIGDLTRLCTQVAAFRSFDHLRQLEDGEKKARKAEIAVAQLRRFIEPHQEAKSEEAQVEARQRKTAEKIRANTAMRIRLDALKTSYLKITTMDPQARGFALEGLLQELFELFDLDPKASFRNTGEQIDGAFSLDGTDYLFEARWRQNQSDIGELDAFSSKVTRKLENTLGVMLSINGFSTEAIAAHSKSRPSIVLIDGAHLMAVLDERIGFAALLLRKKRHAAQTGSIYLPVSQIL